MPDGIDPTLPPDRLITLLVDQLPIEPGAFAWLHREWCSGASLEHCSCRVILITYQTRRLQ